MKVSKMGFGLIAVLVIAVAFAGCTGTTTPTAPGGQATPAGGSGAASGPVSGSQLFGGVGYNWVEYKTTSGTGGQQMIMYTKWTKEGKCTVRFEGAGAEQMKGMMPTEIDCSSTGGQTQESNPNQVSPDVKFVKVSTETVTVPAGTFTADKYTATYQGVTSTYWIAGGKPLLKMEGGVSGGKTMMELNGWG